MATTLPDSQLLQQRSVDAFRVAQEAAAIADTVELLLGPETARPALKAARHLYELSERLDALATAR